MTRAEMEAKREDIEAAVRAVEATQAAFWEALSELEFELGSVELDSRSDFDGTTVDELIEAHADEEVEACPAPSA